MIDPRLWASTPGMGRAPLLPDPVQPSAAAVNPRRDIANLLLQAQGVDNRVLPGDRPVGALVRDPATMTQAQQIAEMSALGGFPQEGPAMATRVPGAVAGGLAALGGVPGVGLAAGMMAPRGVEQRQRELANVLTQGMAEAFESGSQVGRGRQSPRANRASTIADAYEAGRQAARGRFDRDNEREQRGGGDIGGTGRDDPGSPASRSGGGGMWA